MGNNLELFTCELDIKILQRGKYLSESSEVCIHVVFEQIFGIVDGVFLSGYHESAE